MAANDVVNRVFRENRRYTGDGKPGEPVNAPLPIGDPQSGVHLPDKAELRAAFLAPLEEMDGVSEQVQEAVETAEQARDVTLAALSSVVLTVFPTLASVQAYSPTIGPNGILLAGNTVEGDIGGYVHLVKVASQPSHLGKVQDAAGNWYELDRGQPINPFFFQRSSHAGDHSLAFSAAVDALIAFGGGTIKYPHRSGVLAWNTAITKTLPARMQAVVDFGTNKFQMGSALFLGGTYQLTPFLTLQGGNLLDLTSGVSQFYTNYLKMSGPVAGHGLRVGDRIYISDTVNTWAGGDGRPCHFATIDYIDTTNNIINFYPGISIDVAVSNAATGQISATGLVVQAYPNDADMVVRGGNFYGSRHPIGANPGTPGQSAGGASPFGLLLQKGRGVVDGTNFYDLCTSLRFKEGSFKYLNSENAGSYNGYGVKIDTRCHALVDNCVITGSRHAVGTGGSHPDGATCLVTNSTIGGARQTFSYTTYPSEEYGAFDLHPSAIWAEAHNCLIIGGITHDNGHCKVVGGRIVTQQIEGIAKFVGNGRSGQSFTMLDVDIDVHPRTPSRQEVGGAGTFGSSAVLFRDSTFSGTGSDWRFVWRGGSVNFLRGTTWNADTDFQVHIAVYIWSHVEIDRVRFHGKGANVRRFLFNARGDGNGNFIIRDCLFEHCSLLIFNEPALDDWNRLFVERNKILNIGTSVAATALDVGGDTSAAGTLQDINITDNHIESMGTTAIISMAAVARRSVTVKDNTCIFTLAGGTLAYALRTNRNQNQSNMWMRFLAQVRGNKIISRGASMTGPNTITAGIQINGLDSVGGLSAAFFQAGDNMVETATTKISTTGNAVTAV